MLPLELDVVVDLSFRMPKFSVPLSLPPKMPPSFPNGENVFR